MTLHTLADDLEKVAAALRKLPNETTPGTKAMLDGELGVGAALLLGYLRGLLEGAKETFTREELARLLELVGEDPEIFPVGLVAMVAKCQPEVPIE